LGGTELIAWRLETSKHFPTWQTAEGAFLVGGRWSSAGRRVLYTSIDPATAIVEVGVHKGFNTLDTVPHTLIEIEISDPARVYLVQPTALPNPSWLRPGTISAGQQTFGDGLLASNPLVVVPSVVSTHSWNLLIDVAGAAGLFSLRGSEAFALDPRLNPTAAAIPRP
jgi:RES domain-containing protein